MICKLEDFKGLWADIVLFLIPPSFGKGGKGSWKYLNCVISRARLRLEFLLPWEPTDTSQHFGSLPEIFNKVSAPNRGEWV